MRQRAPCLQNLQCSQGQACITLERACMHNAHKHASRPAHVALNSQPSRSFRATQSRADMLTYRARDQGPARDVAAKPSGGISRRSRRQSSMLTGLCAIKLAATGLEISPSFYGFQKPRAGRLLSVQAD